MRQANWKSTTDIKLIYRNASFVANNRVVFNIQGNKYRVMVAVQFKFKIVFIRFVGTHAEYDEVDATII